MRRAGSHNYGYRNLREELIVMMIQRTGRQGINLSFGKTANRILMTLVIVIGLFLLLGGNAYAADWTSANSLPTDAGSYILKNNVSISSTWKVNADITLNLN